MFKSRVEVIASEREYYVYFLTVRSQLDQRRAFTLIELSIVLVILGLLAGGVLVGRDLMAAAAVRAQISQIQKYQAAVNTFRMKYGYLPGDISEPYAAQFGFVPRGTYGGTGDGNGVIEGNCGNDTCVCGFCVSTGETGTFWVDLTRVNLVDGNFTIVTPTSSSATATGSSIRNYFPDAKIGQANFIYIYSDAYDGGWNGATDGMNFFGLSAVTELNNWYINSRPGLTVQQAYIIDKKLDDGFPQSGKIQATYYNWTLSNFRPVWAAGGGGVGAGSGAYGQYPTNAATSGSATTCFDNNASGNPQQYSITQNNGNGVNCALSFRFQ